MVRLAPLGLDDVELVTDEEGRVSLEKKKHRIAPVEEGPAIRVGRKVMEGVEAGAQVTKLAPASPLVGALGAITAAYEAGVRGLGQIGEEVTGKPGLERDLRMLVDSAAIVTGGLPGATLPKLARLKAEETAAVAPRIARPAEALSSATPGQRLIGDLETRGMAALDSSPELNALRLEAMEKLKRLDATEPIVKETLSRDVNQAVLELLEAGEVRLAPDIKISDQVMDLLQTNILEPEIFQAILARNNVNPVKFLEQVTQGELGVAMRQSATLGARTLQKLSELRKAEMRIRALAGEQSDDVAAFLAQQQDIGDRGATSFIRRVGNIWRGSLVSQLATAVRNFETSVMRGGVDVLVEGMERGLRTVFSSPIQRRQSAIDEPLTAWGDFVGLVGPRKAIELTKAITAVKPSVREGLFARYAGDVSRASGSRGLLGGVERAVDMSNFFNRVQDKILRSSFFSAELRQRMAAKGLDLDDAMANNRIGSIPDDLIKTSVQAALEKTWAAPIGKGILTDIALGWDKFATLGGRIPNTITPFLRFMVQSMRWQFQHSPLGATRLLHPTELKGLITGKPEQVKKASQALVGSSFLYGAYLIRDSKYAGPQWYEIKLPDGRTIDTRPFAPFSTYLFVADLIKRQNDGTLLGTDFKAVAQGLIGVNFRAGAGLYIVDQLIDQLSGVKSLDKMANIVKSYVGNVLGGFAVPFQTLKDAIAQFDQEERIVRETRDAPLTGPARTRIPFAARGLPEAEFPTRSEPFEREQPLLRQLTGISLRQAPNPAEAELGRLGFTRREILPPTGDLVFDRLMAKHLGPLVENVLGAVVQSKKYQSITDNFAKAELVRQTLPKLRDLARAQAYAEDKTAQIRLKYSRLPRRQRALIESVLQSRGQELRLP
jgi:hypothetical protein